MLVLFVTVFIDLLGFGIVIPLLPFFGERYQASPDQVALLMAVYSLCQFIAAPAWGAWSDRFGRRPILLITLAGTALCYLVLARAQSLWMLFVARGLAGIMAGNIGTAFAYMADITTRENRARGMGLIGAAFGLGFIAGPAIGGILAGADPHRADFALPCFLASGLSAAAFLFAFVRLPESLPAEIRARLAAMPRRGRLDLFLEALKKPRVGTVLAGTFLTTVAFAGMESTFALWSERQFHWGPQQNGYIFATVGVVSAAIQGGLIRRLAKAFGEVRLVIQGAIAVGIGMALIPFAHRVPVLVVALIAIAYGFGVSNPSYASLISLAVPPEEQGAMMGVSRSATTLGRVAGPALAGALFTLLGRNGPFFADALVMLVVLWLGLSLSRRPLVKMPAE